MDHYTGTVLAAGLNLLLMLRDGESRNLRHGLKERSVCT